MIETRFKKTEIGEIPEEWVVKRIGEICDINTGRCNTQDKIDDGKYPFFVRSQQIERINSFSYDCEAVLTAGDGVGTGKVFHYINGKFEVHQRVYVMYNFVNNIDGKFFYWYFSNNFYNRVHSMTAKSSVDSVRKEMIAEMECSIPPLPEQQRIATALSDIDALLSALTKKIEKKKLIKQGAMQQLLTGKKRLAGFTEPWEERVVGETFKLIGNNTFSREQLSNIGIVSNIHYGDVLIKFHSIIDLRKVVLPKIKIEHRLAARNALSCGDIVMADTAEDNIVGKACEVYGMTSELVEAGLHTIVLRPLIQFAPMFLGYYLNSTSYHDKLMPHIQGIKVSSISKAALLSTSIFVPTDIAEQSAIATLLSDMDKEIEALEAKRTKYTQVKQGMMQQLLTGKIRLVD